MSTGLVVVCRVHDGENAKPRPSWYSKELALASLARAADQVGAPVHVLCDGALRSSLKTLVGDVGPVSTIRGGSARASYRAMLAHAAAQDGPDDELVWFSEDDHLYRPDALARALDVTERSTADYVTLSGSECVDPHASRWHPRPRPEPGAAGEPAPIAQDAVTWYPALATASTFGVRRRTLREDLSVLRAVPFGGGAWDTATCLVLQGYRPYAVRDLAGGGARDALRVPVRAAVSLLALRHPSRRRVLLGPDPELARHLELPEEHPRTPPSPATAAYDWEALAAETARWADARGWPVPVSRTTDGH